MREETRETHERLEAALPLGRAALNRDDYARLLGYFYELYAVLQPQLDARNDWHLLNLDWKARRAVFNPLHA
ncbi:hypothetical protein ACI3PF_21655, partial [Lactococcus lactis]